MSISGVSSSSTTHDSSVEDEIVHTWNLKAVKVILIRTGDKLSYESVEGLPGSRQQISLPPGMPMAECIKRILQLRPRFNGIKIEFIANAEEKLVHTWDLDNELLVHLIRRENQLEFEIECERGKAGYEIQYGQPDEGRNPGGEATRIRGWIPIPEGASVEEAIERLMKCHPRVCYPDPPKDEKAPLLPYVDFSENASISSETLYDFQVPSYLDNTKMVDRDNWAVTMIAAGRYWYGHAMIVVEGVKKNSSFIKIAHLVPRGQNGSGGNYTCDNGIAKVITEDISPDTLASYAKNKTETWIRTKDKVQYMLRRVWRDKHGPDPLFFNKMGGGSVLLKNKKACELGNYSAFKVGFLQGNTRDVSSQWTYEIVSVNIAEVRRPDNCATWAARMMGKAEITLPPSKYGFIFTIPVEFTKGTVCPESPNSCVIL